jgi:hypothetical protein
MADERHSEDVIEGWLIGVCGLERDQEIDDGLEFAHPEAAVGKEEGKIKVGRLGAVEGFELGGGFGNLKRLVPSKGEVEAETRRDVGRGEFEGRLVFIDGVLISTEFGQNGAQIGAGFHAIRFGGDTGFVLANGALQIARLMELNGSIKDALRVQDWGTQGRPEQGEPETIWQWIPALPGLEF